MRLLLMLTLMVSLAACSDPADTVSAPPGAQPDSPASGQPDSPDSGQPDSPASGQPDSPASGQPDSPDSGQPGTGEATFSVVLTDGGPKMINAIKAVRKVTGLGLADAKDLVDGAPSVVAKGLSKAAAKEVAATLEEAGVDVDIRPDR